MDLQLLKIHGLKYVETVRDGGQIEAHLIKVRHEEKSFDKEDRNNK